MCFLPIFVFCLSYRMIVGMPVDGQNASSSTQSSTMHTQTPISRSDSYMKELLIFLFLN